ncbi:DUF2973 domain-containing protein [Leptolyngbya sp. AN02str]|uniref:DUF2973 domain-containing protein n=1 Tax=Leptolyngbya sp. AN02str TaxID=3423363 RepID=UPI003D30F5EF
MLQLLYICAFTVLAFLAISNLIRNLMMLGGESQRASARGGQSPSRSSGKSIPHPELLDEQGQVINEPYLVMKSISVDDARERLDALYNSSPETKDRAQDDN